MAIDIQQLQLGTLVALLRRQLPAPVGIESQILEGIKMGKKLLLTSDIAELGGDLLTIEDLRTEITIAATNVTLDVDIVAQTVGDLTININAASIMAPVDVQGSYIMMPVDVQGQYITLDIDIVAQTVGNINIDIAAQTVGNLAIDISAQTIGNLTIDIETQSVGIYMQPEWAALQGNDKNFEVWASNLDWNDTVEEEYEVPAGKTLYITGCSFRIGPYTNTDYDHHFYAAFFLQDRAISGVALDAVVQLGGVGGSGLTFPKPIPFAAGRYFAVGAVSKTNVPSSIYCYAWGYEV